MHQSSDRLRARPINLPPREQVVARIQQATEEANFLRRLLRLIESRTDSPGPQRAPANG